MAKNKDEINLSQNYSTLKEPARHFIPGLLADLIGKLRKQLLSRRESRRQKTVRSQLERMAHFFGQLVYSVLFSIVLFDIVKNEVDISDPFGWQSVIKMLDQCRAALFLDQGYDQEAGAY